MVEESEKKKYQALYEKEKEIEKKVGELGVLHEKRIKEL